MATGTFNQPQLEVIKNAVNEAGKGHSPKYTFKEAKVEALAGGNEQMHVTVDVDRDQDKEAFGNSPAVPDWPTSPQTLEDMLYQCIDEIEQHIGGVAAGSEDHDADPVKLHEEHLVEERVAAEENAPQSEPEPEPRRYGMMSAGGGRPTPMAQKATSSTPGSRSAARRAGKTTPKK